VAECRVPTWSAFSWSLRSSKYWAESPLLNNRELNPYPNKPKLSFKEDGTFKVTVFSDLHFGENPWDTWGPQQDVNSTILINRVLTSEKPDYVSINGDLITGENTFKQNSTKLIDEIVAPLNAFKIPFSSTYGNHDNNVNITHVLEMKRELEIAPLSYTRPAPPGVGGPGGPGTYWVPIYSSQHATTPRLILWFFDSQGGFKTDGTPMPDWVDATVSPWLKSEVQSMKEVWGSAPRQHLVFTHIPPYEILKLQANINNVSNPGLNADTLGDGSVQSSTTPLSTCGNDCDEPFWDTLTSQLGHQGIIAIVSGHDHGNEWCAVEPTKDVIFCFDKHTGYGGYSSPGWNHGVRNFVFTLAGNDPLDVRSWIRYEAGDVKAQVKLVGSRIIVQN